MKLVPYFNLVSSQPCTSSSIYLPQFFLFLLHLLLVVAGLLKFFWGSFHGSNSWILLLVLFLGFFFFTRRPTKWNALGIIFFQQSFTRNNEYVLTKCAKEKSWGKIFSFFPLFLTCSLQVPNGFPSGSQCVPQGFSQQHLAFIPYVLPKVLPLLTYIGPKGELLHLAIESSISGSFHSFN